MMRYESLPAALPEVVRDVHHLLLISGCKLAGAGDAATTARVTANITPLTCHAAARQPARGRIPARRECLAQIQCCLVRASTDERNQSSIVAGKAAHPSHWRESWQMEPPSSSEHQAPLEKRCSQKLCAVVASCGFSYSRGDLSRRDWRANRERLVPGMEPAKLTHAVVEALQTVSGDAVGFSTLGVGGGTARLTLEQHRAVDVELNAAFARGLKASGKVQHLAFMSAIGANANARTTGSGAAGMARYARVKGEAEAAVTRDGPAVVSIFRPAMIIGSRHTPWLLSVILPLFGPLTPRGFTPSGRRRSPARWWRPL